MKNITSKQSNHVITVITVVKNDISNIKKTIESAVDQNYPHIQYIVIDGSSTDGTLEIINKYKDKIDTIISEPDGGIYDAMNKGLGLASGELVLFLNSGDHLATSDVLSHVAKIYRENTGLGFIFGSIILNYSKLNIQKKINREFTKQKMGRGQQPPHPATFYKTSILHEHGGFDTQYVYSADFDLFCRLIKKNYPCITIDMPITFFQSGGASAKLSAKIETYMIIKNHFSFNLAIRYLAVKLIESTVKSILRATGILAVLHHIKKFKLSGNH
ncbi:MAG TPA: glycosyltransferase family 2 protein [Spirochaetota bacterium]|nr:glycosyltransferase family 2 protein [Spirochaetota bacterium]HPR48994.1 glycosyltransferase family 2 protein [Spirochaetota bacterium]